MKCLLKIGLLTIVCAATLVAVSPAKALMIAPPPPALRAAVAPTIVVGKVESIEEKTVTAARYPGDKEKGEFQIAVIKIQDPLTGAKGLTHVRVGFQPLQGNPGTKPIIGRRPTVSFVKDQEVLVFLTPHSEANFHIAQNYYDVVGKQGNPNFEKEVAEVKTFVKLLADPKAGLKSAKADEQLMTAAMLITQYRTPRQSATQPKTEAVDAEISKLILTTLGEANWANQNPQFFQMNPQNLFYQLGITEKDGWTPPMIEVKGRKQVDYKAFPEAAKKWCKDNADKYKIQRFVSEEKKSDK